MKGKHIKQLIVACILMLAQRPLTGQNIGATGINESGVTPWLESDMKRYEGVYHFGENDGSNLILLINDSTIIVQIRNMAYWTNGGYAVEAGETELTELEIKWEYQNLTAVIIRNGKFQSGQYHGEFVLYTDGMRTYKGLKINNPWNNWIGEGRYEIGIKHPAFDLEKWFPGKYPQASIKKLTRAELDSLHGHTLRFMRNEIYARYHFKFIEGSEMDQYFRKQNWYLPRYGNVINFLTDIELANIELIKQLEKAE